MSDFRSDALCGLVHRSVVAFTQQQVHQDLLSSQSVAPCETHDSANDPRDSVPRKSQQSDHGATASPGGRRVGAHPHALGQADVNGEEGVHGYSLEGRVEQHAVFLRQFGGLPPIPAAAVGRFFALLAALGLHDDGGSGASGAAAALGGAAWLLVEGYELGSIQDTVSLPDSGSHIERRWHFFLTVFFF